MDTAKQPVAIPTTQPTEGADPGAAADVVDRLSYAQELVAKQYELYQWCETKIQSLVTVNGLLLGGFFLLLDKYPLFGWGEKTVAAVTSVLLGLSLVLTLYHVIPRLNSGVGNTDNPRSVIGIVGFGNKESYFERFRTLDYELMLRYTTNQLYGMNTNILRNDRIIRRAVWLTMVGVALIVGLLLWKAL